MNRIAMIGLCVLGLLGSACGADGGDSSLLRKGAAGEEPGGPEGAGDPNDPAGGGKKPGAGADNGGGGDTAGTTTQCKPGIEYVGFDGVKLVADRADGEAGIDRLRMKPFSMLSTEYPRVLGRAPASLAGAAATFGAPPARWFEEPQASAIGLQTSYGVAFDGCLTYTETDAVYAAAPTTQSAGAVCADLGRKFWSRIPTTAEIDACVSVAIDGSKKETNARRRWAYACASVLSSAGFLTY